MDCACNQAALLIKKPAGVLNLAANKEVSIVSQRSDKKAKHERKREARRRELVRARNASPYRTAGRIGEAVACYINADWQEQGIAAMYVLKRVPGGGMIMAAFFVDLWCAGLKDAWGWLNASREEFEEQVLHGGMTDQVELVRTDLDLVKQIVAGGLRFAEQNGFRLPPRYERWVAVLGDIGDWRSADLGEFGVEGGLRWVGPMSDLKKRLIGCSIDEFLARKDVEFITDVGGDDESFEDAEFDGVDEDEDAGEIDEEIEEFVDDLHNRWTNAVRQWCFANGQVPHPRMGEAVGVLLESLMQIPADSEGEGEDSAEEHAAVVFENLNRLIGITQGPDAEGLRAAMAQVDAFVQSFPKPEAMAAAIGLDPSSMEED